MTGFKPKRFDVAGAHPDEAWRAVSNIGEEIRNLREEWRQDGYQGGELDVKTEHWLRSKPLRFGNAPDRDVQRFLAQGVKLMDEIFPFGFGRRQYEVRQRCDELSKSMEKVLAQRADEPQPFDPWRPVRMRVETVKDGLSANDTREKYRLALRGCFPRGPAQAQRGRAVYRVWEENAERLGNNPPMPEAAKPWQRFLGVIENMKQRDQAKGMVWGRVDEDGIDFRPALQPRPVYQSKPKMRM